MANKVILDRLSIYIPTGKLEHKPIERLIALGKKRDRSVNYLVIASILKYLDEEGA